MAAAVARIRGSEASPQGGYGCRRAQDLCGGPSSVGLESQATTTVVDGEDNLTESVGSEAHLDGRGYIRVDSCEANPPRLDGSFTGHFWGKG